MLVAGVGWIEPDAVRPTAQPLDRVRAITATTTTLPSTGFAARSATRRLPFRMPASLIETPSTSIVNVVVLFWIKYSVRSIGVSR